jgi:ketosteroid isomerase-like protein
MKTLLRLIAVAGLAGAAWAAENWTKEQQAVANVFKTWSEAELAKDNGRIMSLMAPELTFWNFRKAGPLDRAGFEKMSADFMRKMKTSAFDIRTDAVLVKGAYAVAHGHYAETFTDPQGTLINFAGPWTSTLQRSGDQWLVLTLSYTDDAAPADRAAVEREVAQLEHAWAKAYVDQDTATLDRLEADD